MQRHRQRTQGRRWSLTSGSCCECMSTASASKHQTLTSLRCEAYSANAGRDYHLAVFIPRVSTTTMAGNGGNMAVRVPRGTSIHYVLEVRCEFQEDMDMLDDTRDVRAVLEEDPQRGACSQACSGRTRGAELDSSLADGVAAIVRSNGNTKSAGSALFPTGAAARLAPRSKRVRVYQGLVKVSPELCPSFTFGQVSCSYTMRFIVA